MYSSNIGAARWRSPSGATGSAIPRQARPAEAVPTRAAPKLGGPQVPERLAAINVMTIAFGHGISASPLQIATRCPRWSMAARCIDATSSSGRRGEPVPGEQVMSETTSDRDAQASASRCRERHRQARRGAGYLVGGKTGTAEKVSGRSYDKQALISSFVGVFPMNDPRYFIHDLLDEPHGDKTLHRSCDGRLDGGPGVRPHRRTHGVAARNSAGRRRFARVRRYVDGRLAGTRLQRRICV